MKWKYAEARFLDQVDMHAQQSGKVQQAAAAEAVDMKASGYGSC